MHDAEGRTDVRACAETKPLAIDEELRLSFEHIERIDVVVVAVRIGPFETGLELELDQSELISADLDRCDSVFTHESFAFAGREEDRLRSGSATTRRSIDAVEAAGLAAIALLQIPREATVRRVEVQEPCTRRAPEPVDDLRRSAGARSRRQQLLVVVDEHRKPALEDVERIHVLPVEMRIRSGASIGKERLRDADLIEVRLDDDPSAEERLALAGSVHDSWHLGRV